MLLQQRVALRLPVLASLRVRLTSFHSPNTNRRLLSVITSLTLVLTRATLSRKERVVIPGLICRKMPMILSQDHRVALRGHYLHPRPHSWTQHGAHRLDGNNGSLRLLSLLQRPWNGLQYAKPAVIAAAIVQESWDDIMVIVESKHNLITWVHAFLKRRPTSSSQGGASPSVQTPVAPALPRVNHDVSESNSLGYTGLPSVGTWHMSLPLQLHADVAAVPLAPPSVQACIAPPGAVAHHYIGSPCSQECSKPNSIEEQYDKLDRPLPEPSLESAQLGAQVPLQAVSTIPFQSAPVVMPQLYGSTSSSPQAAAS